MVKIRPGGWCWVALAGGVAAADAVLIQKDHSTMSAVFGDALIHPVKRWPVLAAWAVLTLHLFSVFFPHKVRRFDPIHGVAVRFSNRRDGATYES